MRLLVSIMLAVVLPFGQAAAAPVLPREPVAPAVSAELPKLPSDPTGAATTLVGLLLGADAKTASLALTEILRRSAIPVVSQDGTIVALPDRLALIDGIIYAELVPDLAASVRSGDFYAVENVAWLIVDSLGFDGELPPSAIVGGLGRWGKEPDDPVESAFAGAVVRALSAARGDVLYESAPVEEIELDPLQVILLVEHLMSPAVPRAEATSSRAGPLAFLSVPVAAAADPCSAVYDKLKKRSQTDEATQAFLKDVIKDAIKGSLVHGREAWDTAGKFSDANDKAAAIASTIILLLNVRLEVTDDHNGQTHTRHSAGEVDKHVTFTAHAYMKAGFDQQTVKCLYFIGLDVPPVGDLPNFRVRWSYTAPQTAARRDQLVRVASADTIKISPAGGGGELTGALGTPKSGRSTLKLEVAIEDPPNRGELLTSHVEVRASLDKDDFPFKLKDLLKLDKIARGALNNTSPWAVAIDKIFELVNSAIKRLGLPTQRKMLDVEYHGADIYLVRGETDVFLFYYTATVYVDVYSCKGLNGPWMGEGGFKNLDGTLFKDAAEKVFGVQMPNNQTVIGVVNQELARGPGDELYLTVLSGGGSRLRLVFDVNLTQVLTSRVSGQTVGTAELRAEYDSLQPLSLSGSPARYPVKSIDPSQLAANSQNVCESIRYRF